jgi:hypothetical protein
VGLEPIYSYQIMFRNTKNGIFVFTEGQGGDGTKYTNTTYLLGEHTINFNRDNPSPKIGMVERL